MRSGYIQAKCRTLAMSLAYSMDVQSAQCSLLNLALPAHSHAG